METFLKLLAACLTLLSSCTSSAQGWTRINALPHSEFTAFQVIDGTIYTATGNMLYTSSDNGETWNGSEFTNEEDIHIFNFKKFGNRIFAGTEKGVFSALATAVEGLWRYDINTFEISSFAERDNRLYASIQGAGVIRYNGAGWSDYSNGLPNYSYNVSKIVDTPGELLALAGGNGTFYRFNSAQGQWTEDYYTGNFLPGLIIQDAMLLDGVLYASLYNMILRSDDFGANWITDQAGLPYGQGRFMYAGQEDLYALTTDGESTTKINRRPIDASAGAPWNNDSEVLPIYTWAMGELGNKTFLAANQGVYVFDTTMGHENPQLKNVVIYPNPSADGRFTLQTEATIDELTVYDLSGRSLTTEKHLDNGETFTVPNPGLYIVSVTIGNTSQTYKIAMK